MPSEAVYNWLGQLRSDNELRYQHVIAIRKLITSLGSSISEEIKYGGILYSTNRPFCGIYPYTNHVAIEFSNGASLPDEQNLLEGKGKGRRHIKIATIDDLDLKYVREYIIAAHRSSLLQK